MSFITLQSKRNEISPQALDSSYFRNDFKNGILIKPGDTISLVNLTINTKAEFIVNEMNDTIVFRLGNRQFFNDTQAVATMEHGAFDGKTMESVINTALNNAVVGGIWKRAVDATTGDQYGFQTEYDKSDPGHPKFKINMVQQVREGENLSDKEGYATILNTLPSGDEVSTDIITTIATPGSSPLYHIDGSFDNLRQGSTDLERGNFSQLDLGERGIFLNGGSAVLECKPVAGIDTTSIANALSSFTNLYDGGNGGLTGDVWEVIDSQDNPTSWLLDNAGNQNSQVDCNVSNTGVGSWDLKLTFTHPVQDGTGGTTATFFLHSRSHDTPGQYNGVFVMGTNSSTNPEDSANWDAPIPFWYWDKDNGRLVGSPNQNQIEERKNEGNNSLISHILRCKDPANLITATLVSCVGYNTCRVGLARQQFYYGDKNVADEALNTTPTGMDASIGVLTNTTNLIPFIDCCRIVASKKFGLPNWRDGNNTGRYTFPSGMGQTPSLNDPSLFGSNFVAGDRVKIGLEITNQNSFNFFIEMAKEATPDDYSGTRINIASIGRATSPAALITQQNSPIKQTMFNLRAVSAYGGGGFYQPAHYVLKGINDRQNYSDTSVSTYSTEPHAESLMRFSHTATAPLADLVGTWKVVKYGVGPYPGSFDWHYYDEGTNPHYDDDRYVFEAGGRFDNVFGEDGTTELEAWQAGFNGEGEPVAPHDNSEYSTYVYTAVGANGVPSITLNGKGSYIGLPKAVNGAELSDSANTPDSRTYDMPLFTPTEINLVMPVQSGVFWSFILIKDSADIITPPSINEPAIPYTTSTVGDSTPPPPITNLNTLFKFGIVGSGDLGSDLDIEPNIANANDLLGMANSKEATTLANTFEIISSFPPEGSGTDLNMMVCLEDFNITGKNGNTGDDTKIICVVPKEQLTQSDSNRNILHYNADFPIPIDLNPPTEQTYYSLTASLRDMEGKFIRSLEAPTHLTLLHERDKKTAMAEAVSNAIEKANERRANIQSNIIENAGLNNPRV